MRNFQARKGLYGFLLAGVLLMLIVSVSEGAVWTTEAVDDPPNFSHLTSRTIALDSNGNPHIAYGGDHLYHAYYDGGSWHYETVDSSSEVGAYASIAIDSSDNVHISYSDSSNHDLKYATNASGAWVTQTIDSEGWVGSYTSIAIDSSDNVHISYYSLGIENSSGDFYNGGLKYATNAAGAWVIQAVDSKGSHTSIAIDSSNNVHIIYTRDAYYSYELYYATNASGSWVIQTLDGSAVDGTVSIAIDSSDNVHISYSAYHDFNHVDLKHATNASGAWVTETIDSEGWVGYDTSIAIDSSDNVHISHGNKYTTNAPGTWVTQTVDSEGDVPGHTSIAIDPSDNVHINYSVGYYYSSSYLTTYGLKYATNASGSWVTQTIDSEGDVGWYISIAIDSSDNLHISYYDRTNKDLKYATNASGTWVTQTVDSEGGVYTSIAIDSSDNVHISYSEAYGSRYWPTYLKYATNASGTWVTQTLDSEMSVGEDTSIAIDSSDNVHISYYDRTNNALKYATNASGSWVTQTLDNVSVDKEGDLGRYSSIAIDSSDNVHISYYYYYCFGCAPLGDGQEDYDLKYATNASGAWATQTLDSEGGGGKNTSIAIDSSDNMHISHGRKYTTNASGTWVNQIIDSEGYGGYHTSIAIDSSDNVHMSSHDWSNLTYTTNATGSWVTETLDSEGDVGKYSSIAIDSSDNVHISYEDNSNRALKYATNAVAVPPFHKHKKRGKRRGH